MEALSGLLGDDAPAGSEFSFSTTMDFFDYGADFSIATPPEDEIVGDFTQIQLDLVP